MIAAARWVPRVRSRAPIAKVIALALAVALATLASSTWRPAHAMAAAPLVEGRAAIVVDADTGEVLFEKDAHGRMQIASLTKLMTVAVVLDDASMTERFLAPHYPAEAVESVIDLERGERMTVRDLLYGLVLASGNDAAVTLARGSSGTVRAFVAEMNRQARELGLADTRFANPIGLDDPRNYSTAADLATLARDLLEEREFRRIADSERATLRSGAKIRRIKSRNALLHRFGWVNGVKTGHTESSGWSLVGSATRKGVTTVTVVLGAPTEAARDADTLELMRFGFDQYERVTPVRAGESFSTERVRWRDDDVTLTAARTFRVTVRKGRKVSTRVDAPSEANDTKRGRRVGRVVVSVQGEELDRVPLKEQRTVAAAGIGQILFGQDRWIRTVLAIVALALCALLVAAAVIRHRRSARRRGASQVRKVR